MAFAALAAGVSGLQAFTEGVGVIADNITNVNTIGYKETRSRFSTLVTETAALSSYSPGGVRAFSETLVSKQGLLQPSGSATDLSIDGAGFFVVRNSQDAEDADAELLYTRAGAFTQDNEGFFKNTAGLYLMGWPTDSNGGVTVNQSQVSELEPININNLNGLGAATTEVALRVNLDVSTTENTAYTAGGLGSLADGSVEPDFETNVTIYDSQGRAHVVNIAVAKSNAANEWEYEIFFDDDSVLDATDHPDGIIGSGTLVFNTDGSINLAGAGGSSSMNDSAGAPITFPGGSIPINFDDASVIVDDGSVVFDFGDDGAENGFVQSATTSSRLSSSVDGAAFGDINGVSIGEDGIVTALFDNGLTLSVYKLPVAVFQNPDGLGRRQGNAFGASDLSGDVSLQSPGDSGAGSISPNSLEQSTVDLASEFAELIKVQRAFSASTRIISTSDEILEELTRI